MLCIECHEHCFDANTDSMQSNDTEFASNNAASHYANSRLPFGSICFAFLSATSHKTKSNNIPLLSLGSLFLFRFVFIKSGYRYNIYERCVLAVLWLSKRLVWYNYVACRLYTDCFTISRLFGMWKYVVECKDFGFISSIVPIFTKWLCVLSDVLA